MIKGLLLLALVGVCAASGYIQPKLRYNKCFQCSYNPPKTITYKVPKQEEYEYKVPTTSYDCKEEKVPLGYQPTYGHALPPSNDKDVHGPPHGARPHGHGWAYPPQPAYGYVRRCYPKVEYETRKGYRTTYEDKSETSPAGGFNPCMGPITAESAKKDGVDDWDCHSNCYTRTDGYGNVVRGCYKGEFGVNPYLLGCHYQAGQKYCFCDSDHCNGEKAK